MSDEKKAKGDRIVQIILLILIAIGIATFPVLMSKKSSKAAGGPGGPGGAPAAAGTEASSDDDDSVAVEVQKAEIGTVQKYIRVNGDVSSASSVDIYPDIDGKLVSVKVELGDYVKKGDVIATVDPSQPGQVYAMSSVKATVSGTITDIDFDAGETVSTSSVIVTIGDLTDLEIVTYIPERYVQYVKKGLVAEVEFDAYPDESFNAQVTEVTPVLDTDSRSQKISLSIGDDNGRVKVGMFASMKLVIQEAKDVVTVPELALTTYYDDDVVYVVTDDNKAEMRKVTVGLSSTESVEIKDGLSEGETVVTRGLSSISDGSTVRVVE